MKSPAAIHLHIGRVLVHDPLMIDRALLGASLRLALEKSNRSQSHRAGAQLSAEQVIAQSVADRVEAAISAGSP